MRAAVAETTLGAENLVLPAFVCEGKGVEIPINAMPGQSRLSVDRMVSYAQRAQELGIAGLALFPAISDALKDPLGKESQNPNGLLQQCIRAVKEAAPKLLIIPDVALDPYSSDGHDGVVRDGKIVNDETVGILAAMAVAQARAGADIVAPSDMMDGRVAAIRDALDEAGFTEVGICSYCVKYASSFYGPFRDALDSAPRGGDKKTYQMDPRNAREALREVALDEAEGADWLMVKPGLPYLDVVQRVRQATVLPVSVYHVSGEYSMLKAAAAAGYLDYNKCMMESLYSLRRAGADIIFTYAALEAAELLRGGYRLD